MKNKSKRILALAGAVLLVLLYASTLIFALMKSETAQTLLQVSVLCTMAVPIMLYGYLLVFKLLKKKKEDMEKENSKEK